VRLTIGAAIARAKSDAKMRTKLWIRIVLGELGVRKGRKIAITGMIVVLIANGHSCLYE
jgi:hypothetical protein